MALLELFISKEKYMARINQLDVQLSRLNSIAADYDNLINQLKDQVMASEDDNFTRLTETVKEEAKLLKVQILNAQTTRGLLVKTVDHMAENQTLVESTIDNAKETISNTVNAAAEAAQTAAAAAGVAALIV